MIGSDLIARRMIEAVPVDREDGHFITIDGRRIFLKWKPVEGEHPLKAATLGGIANHRKMAMYEIGQTPRVARRGPAGPPQPEPFKGPKVAYRGQQPPQKAPGPAQPTTKGGPIPQIGKLVRKGALMQVIPHGYRPPGAKAEAPAQPKAEEPKPPEQPEDPTATKITHQYTRRAVFTPPPVREPTPTQPEFWQRGDPAMPSPGEQMYRDAVLHSTIAHVEHEFDRRGIKYVPFGHYKTAGRAPFEAIEVQEADTGREPGHFVTIGGNRVFIKDTKMEITTPGGWKANVPATTDPATGKQIPTSQHLRDTHSMRPRQIAQHLRDAHGMEPKMARKGYERELWHGQHENAHDPITAPHMSYAETLEQGHFVTMPWGPIYIGDRPSKRTVAPHPQVPRFGHKAPAAKPGGPLVTPGQRGIRYVAQPASLPKVSRWQQFWHPLPKLQDEDEDETLGFGIQGQNEKVPGSPSATRTFDKVVKGLKDNPKIDNPYAVAWSVVKKTHRKSPSGKWVKKKSEIERQAYMRAMRQKEAAAATSLAQLFRPGPVRREWEAWRIRRMQRQAQVARQIFHEADPADTFSRLPLTPPQQALAWRATRQRYATNAAMGERQFDPNVGGGVDRDKIPAKDFAGPDRSFPIVTSTDVGHAFRSLGRAKDKSKIPQIRRRIISIAKRKGFSKSLPDTAKNGDNKELGLTF